MSFAQWVIGQNAKTTQFPHKSLNGFGILLPSGYGQKHIAMPNPMVNVGAIYNLNCDVVPPKIPPAPAGIGGRMNGMLLAGNDMIGNHLPSV